jgi:hypothetical protein
MENLSDYHLHGIKAVLFDAGGTLLHLDSSYICRCIKEELGVRLNEDHFRHAQFLGMSRVAELVAVGAGSTENLKREFYSMLLPEVGVYAGATGGCGRVLVEACS